PIFIWSSHLRIAFLWWLALTTSFAGFTPQSAPGQTQDDVIRIDTSLVHLNIGVTDRQGKQITELQRNGFAIYEDGLRQNLMSFESTTTPFSLALLLDVSGSTLSFR